MSAKRSAPQEIDEKTLQHKKEEPQHNGDNGQKHTENRQVVTVKKVEGSENGNKPTETKEQEKPKTSVGLFSGLFTNNGTTNKPSTAHGSGLFSSTSQSLFANTSGSLFANTGSTGLFANKPTTGLFGNNASTTANQPKTGGLFSSTPSLTSGSIFNFQSGGVPPIKNSGSSLFASNKQNDDDESGDSAELEAAQNLEADPSKSTHHYKYEQTCRLIVKQKAFKFKKVGGDMIENVDIIVTQDNQSQLYYITVQLPATKKSIYTGLLLPNKSQVKHLNNKKENVEVSAFMIVNKKPQQAILRCQFQKQDQCIQLHDTIDQIVKGKYTYKQSTSETKQQAEKHQQKKQEVKKN